MKDFLKGSLKSKTMWFSAVVSTIGVIESNYDLVNAVLGDNYGSLMVDVVEANISFLQAALGEQSHGWVIFGIGIVSALLRAVTKESLTKKGENNQ